MRFLLATAAISSLAGEIGQQIRLGNR